MKFKFLSIFALALFACNIATANLQLCSPAPNAGLLMKNEGNLVWVPTDCGAHNLMTAEVSWAFKA